MRYVSKYFSACELLPPDVYNKSGDAGVVVMDDRILWTLDKIREKVKSPIIVNNWKTGGPFSQRGFRNDSTGAVYSQHRYGRAVDFDVKGMTAEQFRELVKKGTLVDELKFITRMEDGVNWIHIDCMGMPKSQGQPIEYFNA